MRGGRRGEGESRGEAEGARIDVGTRKSRRAWGGRRAGSLGGGRACHFSTTVEPEMRQALFEESLPETQFLTPARGDVTGPERAPGDLEERTDVGRLCRSL